MRASRKTLGALIASLALGLLAAAPAQAEFGIVPGSLDGSVKDANGKTYAQASGHPWEASVNFELNTELNGIGRPIASEADLRNAITEIPAGFVGNPLATPRCDRQEFLNRGICPASTQVGVSKVFISRQGGELAHSPVYNLVPSRGVPAEFGFTPGGVLTIVRPTLRSDGDYGITANVLNVPQIASVLDVSFTIWGQPAHPAHDSARGDFTLGNAPTFFCGLEEDGSFIEGPPCPSDAPEIPFWTMPSNCAHGPFDVRVRVISWLGHEDEAVFTSHDDAGNPQGVVGCESVPFDPEVASAPTSKQAESGTGLDFELTMPQGGLLNPVGTAQSHLKDTVVTLPEGVTVNPSVAEGLDFCTPADLAREKVESVPGAGCPNASKIGSVLLRTPLLEETIEGSVHIAQQDDPTTSAPGAENPFDSLIAFYIVLKNPERGIIVKLPAKVEPDPRTGQLVTTVENSPQLPFSSFKFHFREGQRSPLITPPACGTYTTETELTPWSDPGHPVTVKSSFEITEGMNAGPCPPGGVPPFKPHFQAGSINNNAGSHSPFYMRLIRGDGEQDMTRFSSVLPPGLLGKLAGVGKCPDAAVEAAKAKTGRQELASPSCPANSQIGRSLAGAGVGGALTHVPGRIYLGGPHKGAPLSVISVTPAVAGPFDAGTVVVRLGLDLDPETAEVEVDGAASDPIPHILKGIPLKVRDIRVYVDRENFTLNPTSCDPSSAKATLFGGFLDAFDPSDDVPVALAARYQAANCLNLGFKPRLKLNLKGGTRRGDHPGLRAVLTPRPGDANIAAARATLPRSAFLEQAHIRTICTRVQFAANQCPPGSIYGHAKAWTPLLDEPFEGPVILRSSDNKLPDLVLALKGLVDVNVSSRVDSHKGGIRNSFELVPDAPVSRFVLTLQGGRKGLIVNSRDLCESKARASVRFTAHNGKVRTLRPELRPQCGGKR
jgi:hypothetical protein